MEDDWPEVLELPVEKLRVWFKVPGWAEQNPQARQIEEAISKKFSKIPDNFGEQLTDELLNGQYKECKSLSGLVKQFADRCESYSVHRDVATIIQGPAPDKVDQICELRQGDIVDIVSDWNMGITFIDCDNHVWARCLEPKLSSCLQPAWQPTKKNNIQVRFRVLRREGEAPDGMLGGELAQSPFWVKIGKTDPKKLGKKNTLPVIGEPLLQEEPKHQTLVISQSKLENIDGDRHLEDPSGTFGWPDSHGSQTWDMFCQLLYERFKDPQAGLLKVDKKFTCLAEARSKLADPACLLLRKRKNKANVMEVFNDIKDALLTLDMERLLDGCDDFESGDDRHEMIGFLLDQVSRVTPSVKADGELDKRYDEFRALKSWKVMADLEDAPPHGYEDDEAQPVKLRPYWTEQEWDEYAGTPELWTTKMHEQDVLMLLLLRMAELELPHGGNGVEGPNPITRRLQLLKKLSTMDERAGRVRNKVNQICNAVDAITNSKQLKIFLATVRSDRTLPYHAVI